jgi:AcrR family transcriptional regulator
MGAVAELAGVSRRAVYLHFSSRTELLSAVYRRTSEADGLAAARERIWQEPDAVSALTAWARHVSRGRPDIAAACRTPARGGPCDPDAAPQTPEEGYMDCRRLAAWLDRENRLAPGWTITTAADMLWALTRLDPRVLEHRGWSRDEYADRLATLLHGTFVAAGGGRP